MPENIQGVVTIVGPETYLQRMMTDDRYFAKPYFQGIFVFDPEYAVSELRPPYYGDTMMMRTWDFLRIPFGEIDDDEEVLTRIDGWRYIYNHSRRTFTVYNQLGGIYIRRNNIQTIGDLHIDFTIQMSHQFMIVFDSADLAKFFPIVKLRKKLYGDLFIWDMPNSDCGDRLYGVDRRRYYPNSNLMDKRVASVENYIVDMRIPIRRVVYEEAKPKALMTKNVDITENKAVTTTKVYDATYKPFNAVHKKQLFKAKALQWSMLYFMLSHCMYPKMNIIIRRGEDNNNRPLYEPWLIWGVFKFLILHREEVEDDGYEIDVFDYLEMVALQRNLYMNNYFNCWNFLKLIKLEVVVKIYQMLIENQHPIKWVNDYSINGSTVNKTGYE